MVIVSYGYMSLLDGTYPTCRSWHSSVIIVTRLQAIYPRNWSLILGRGKRFFCSPQRLNWLWGPPSLMCNGCRWFFVGIKRLMYESGHCLSSSLEVKNVMELYLSDRSSDQSTQLAHLSHLDSPLLQQKSKNYNFIQCRLSG
jgi:hypothetical protein